MALKKSLAIAELHAAFLHIVSIFNTTFSSKPTPFFNSRCLQYVRKTIKIGAYNHVSEFLNLGITNTSGWIIPCCGGLSDTVSDFTVLGGGGGANSLLVENY